MARKSSSPVPPASSTPAAAAEPPDAKKTPSLASLRSEIDRMDKELVAILNRRAEIAVQIGKVKNSNGMEIFSAAREEEVLAKVLGASQGPLPQDTLRLIFRELMSGTRSLQRTLRVACLGPKYSYSHLASVAKFGEAVEHVPLGSIAAVFEELNRRHVQFGIVPLENSTDGRIADTLDMFTKLPNLKIRAEVRLRIHHCLLGRCEWSQMRRVYSKSQAISQCRNWLGKNLPQAAKIEVVSTAAAAELAQREEFAGAVASKPAAQAYRLNILAENIEDQSNNVTRFAVIAETPEARTGRDKTTLMARIPNDPGSLVKTIAPLEKMGVNMTWIESFPIPSAAGDKNPAYLFFLDVEGHIDDPIVQKAVDSIRKRCERLDVLGSYPRSEVIES
ncbi:prephenate dehydratase [Paludisphaera mucosa]|uniref:Bifunctional chorismate mutase/prephenate dehydratase n=1 Tax=Paludisphaera mucosa TaxID=3030827 RepID=A0ABT6F7U1_9BACT|nr:prephenate dehydratase [Paludisphaera mucosa]MDG3003566.1 prephenate dehydratase [Paludisphaera mucosa]